MTETIDISFAPFNKKAKVRAGITIADAAAAHNVPIRSDCGKHGICGKCRVVVDDPAGVSPVGGTEAKMLSERELADSLRLACQTRITGPVTITVPDDATLNGDVDGKPTLLGAFCINPAVQRFYVPTDRIRQADQGRGLSLSDRIVEQVQKTDKERIHFRSRYSLEAASRVDMRLPYVTVVHHDEQGVISVVKGSVESSLGVAFDVGTTTLAAYMCDLVSGEILTSRAMINPQRRFGLDVISRIASVIEDEADLEKRLLERNLLDRYRSSGVPEEPVLDKMKHQVITAMDDLAGQCLKEAGREREEIHEITVAGNTTMQHIMAGFNPKSIGVSPYLPVTRSPVLMDCVEIGLDLSPATPVYMFPMVSGFLGGDILAACLADESYKRKDTTLIIDIGTNGELLLINENGIWGTSCATGPAFEGAQISCGMRASAGAVNRVYMVPESAGRIEFETISNADPVGICGSGIIDALAAMRKAGIIRENGTFDPDKPGVVRDEKGLGKAFYLPGTKIHITLNDIRQVQLAKAALFVGIESLLEQAGVETVSRTLLTGAFGTGFNQDSARSIGMLPDVICRTGIDTTPNLAGAGAVMALLDKSKRTDIQRVFQNVHTLDLNQVPDFVSKLSTATKFPANHGEK
ncbi:MAG: ASKHA domain-containing protein [Desulfarculaceae bacterium]|nr:ASKHA domain-containing protein [Desulfarculaceae bacterium]